MKAGFLAAFLSLLLVSSATASSFALEVTNATFKIFHPDSTLTRFLVRRDVPEEAHFLTTTAHTLDRNPADTAVVVLREELPDGALERRDCTVAIRRDGKPLWVRHENRDIAVLPLDGTLQVTSGGPVLVAGSDGHPLVVGIVLERHHHNERTKNAYEERLIRHSLGLGSIPRAKYILSTIETAENRSPTAPSVTLERADGEGIDP